VWCRQEVEELRYEQERLRWQLNQASHLGAAASSLPMMQAPIDPTPTVTATCSDINGDRYVMAKHSAIYPTSEDVSLTHIKYRVSACPKMSRI